MRTSLIGITVSCSFWAFSAAAQTPTFTAASVVNAASMVSGTIAPGMLVNITGSNLGDPSFFRSCSGSTPIPTICFGISVLVNGAAAPVFYNSASQVTFQAPFNISGGTATIQVTSNLSGRTISSGVVNVPVAATAPGLYTISGAGTGTGYYSSEGGLIASISQPVPPGTVVVLFGTGFGATSPTVAAGTLGPNTAAAAVASVTMTINNQSVPVTFAGLEPGDLSGAVVGYDEVVFTVPSGLTVPAGSAEADFPMVVTAGGVASQFVTLRVAPAPLSITSISPNPVPFSASPQTITVNGSGFETGLVLKLQSPGKQLSTVSGSNITFISSSQFTAQVTVGTSGSWGALVDNPDANESSVFSFNVSGTGPVPAITSIVTTWGNEASQAPQIAQNTWIEVHGTNLSQVSMDWSHADFTNGLPTTLGGVSATVNGKAAAVYYVSPAQVNILAPIDSATGTVPVQLNTPYGQTAIKTTTELQTSPAFLVFDTAGHVAARHTDVNYSLLGPSSLGSAFTAAKAGETVLLYAVGFGQTNPPITDQLKGLGPLPTLPTLTIGNLPATVSFAGLSAAGLYQFNVIVPTSAPAGDLALLATYNGSSTQSNVVITVGQ